MQKSPHSYVWGFSNTSKIAGDQKKVVLFPVYSCGVFPDNT